MRSEKGQASLMVGLMMLTFILFFAFVVNVGSLVNAKINLQNAADMAAYSGAAVQARQLNQISFLNYEMRRQYKKFLYRYYVLGNMAQDEAPKGPGLEGPRTWRPRPGTTNYTVPTVCMIFNPQDNYCRLENQPQIQIPQSASLDQITEALRNTLITLDTIRKSFCKAIGGTNARLLMFWLWNTDPELQAIQQQLAEQQGAPQDQAQKNLAKMLTLISQSATGLGLIPREMILKSRIDTLADYVNAPALQGLDLEKVAELEDGTDPVFRERTIQAFYSAYYTLGSHAFDDSKGIVMDELMPGGFGGDSAGVIALKDITTTFDAYAVDFRDKGGSSADSGDCNSALLPTSIDQPIPVGVAKDPTVLTYYAVRLKAKANAIFLPRSWGDLELKAYAAAQPFGSRIGPNLSEADFTRAAPSVPLIPVDGSGNTQSLVGKIPALFVTPEKSWEDRSIQGATQALAVTQTPNGNEITFPGLLQAYHAAMAPNPIEEGKYNILNDLNEDPFLQPFDESGLAAMWAPIFPPEKAEKAGETIAALFDEQFKVPPVRGMNPADVNLLKDQLRNSFTAYIARLKEGKGENGEGFNVVRLENPYRLSALAPGGAGGKRVSLPGDLFLNDPVKVKTSWVNKNDDETIAPLGRVGYSVKFVSFSTLRNPASAPSDGNIPWTNLINADGEFDADSQSIKH